MSKSISTGCVERARPSKISGETCTDNGAAPPSNDRARSVNCFRVASLITIAPLGARASGVVIVDAIETGSRDVAIDEVKKLTNVLSLETGSPSRTKEICIGYTPSFVRRSEFVRAVVESSAV